MTIKTEELINLLAKDGAAVKKLQSPARLAAQLIGVIFIYAAAVGAVLGLRADLLAQLHRPFFLAEISLLLLIISSSLISVVLLLFPDGYQKRNILYWPLYSIFAFISILVLKAFLPPDIGMIIPTGKVHEMECAICIAAVAMIPSSIIFAFLRRGTSVHPFISGVYAALASAGIGCFMIRLAEANDSILHLTIWHYIPTLCFAIIGAFIGKIFLKW